LSRIFTDRRRIQGARQHAGFFHARERSKSIREIESGLFRTHVLPVASPSVLDTDALFPVRGGPITVAILTDVAVAGTVDVELGSTAGRRLTVGVSDDAVSCRAGSTVADDSVVLTHNFPVALQGLLHRIVFAVVPGSGKGKLWIDGVIKDTNIAVNGNFNGDWADSLDGQIFVSGANIARADVYLGQLPRQF